MIHVVSGYHRTGTSMMARALAAASSLPLLVDDEAEAAIRARETTPGYDPNPHGYCTSPWLETGVYDDGVLLKLHQRYLQWLAPGDYRVVVMQRPWSQMQASFQAAFGFDRYAPEEHAEAGFAAAQERADMAVTVLQYEDVIARPQTTFETLAAAGWPIDPGTAAGLVDPSLHRHR